MVRLFAPLFAMFVALSAGCAFAPHRDGPWPEGLPPEQLFVRAYDADLDNREVQSLDQYLTWIRRFYQGWIVYENGWLNMSEDLVSRMPEAEKQLAAERIAGIGLRIAPEWAKEKDDRYIFTRMVAVWGEALLEALEHDQVFQYMDSVDRDIDLLKQGKLGRQDIRVNRYFPETDDSDFFF